MVVLAKIKKNLFRRLFTVSVEFQKNILLNCNNYFLLQFRKSYVEVCRLFSQLLSLKFI